MQSMVLRNTGFMGDLSDLSGFIGQEQRKAKIMGGGWILEDGARFWC